MCGRSTEKQHVLNYYGYQFYKCLQLSKCIKKRIKRRYILAEDRNEITRHLFIYLLKLGRTKYSANATSTYRHHSTHKIDYIKR